MIYVFLGKDINIIKRKIDTLINDLNIDNIIKYDFSEDGFDNILDEVSYIDLFNEKKLLIVSSFSFKKLSDKEEKRLINYINNMSDNVIIIKCIDESLDERKSLTKLLKEKCKIDISEKLDYKALHQYVNDIFKKEKKNITYNQVKKILDLCEYNTDITLNEVEKLLIYKINDKDISDEDINKVISKNNEKEIFNIAEEALKRNVVGCLESYKILLDSGIDTTIILDALAKQYRLLYQIKILHGTMNDKDLAKKLGIRDFMIGKILPFKNEYKEEEILDKLFELSEIDEKSKTNYNDKDKLLESFFISL